MLSKCRNVYLTGTPFFSFRSLSVLHRKLNSVETLTVDNTKKEEKHKIKRKPTQLMQQYNSLKDEFSDFLLFFRLGDFYELFFEDAKIAASNLDIVLTKRGQNSDGTPIPMCGFPHSALTSHLNRLVRRGIRVAICEQVETAEEAKRRGPGSIIRREVVRLVTPGTLTEDAYLDPTRASFLCAVDFDGDSEAFGLSWIDLSTGEFHCTETTKKLLGGDLARIRPSELLLRSDECNRLVCNSSALDASTIAATAGPDCVVTLVPDKLCVGANKSEFVGSSVKDTGVDISPAERSAKDLLLRYVHHTQRGAAPLIRPLSRATASTVMSIDAASRNSLELTQAQPVWSAPSSSSPFYTSSSTGSRSPTTLLTLLQNTATAAGSRLLSSRLSSPLTDAEMINRRLDTVECFRRDIDGQMASNIGEILTGCGDMERALQRLSLGRGGPRDLSCILGTLRKGSALVQALQPLDIYRKDLDIPIINDPLQQGSSTATLVELLGDALVEEPRANVSDGGFIRPGFSTELDKWKSLARDASVHVKRLAEKYRQVTGAPTSKLAIKHNFILGYFVEVRTSGWDIDACPAFVLGKSQKGEEENEDMDEDTDAIGFLHCQSTKTARRFKTAELTSLDMKIRNAGDEVTAIENRIFQKLVESVIDISDDISSLSQTIATVDVHLSMAKAAQNLGLVKPTVDMSTDLVITGARHIAVEAAYAALHPTRTFIPNDVILASSENVPDNVKQNLKYVETDSNYSRVWLVTGPNMGGKSTFLRQTAQIVCLAQAGSFVPAAEARIGVVDRLFSRVGASDDISRGRSTFHVEMEETSQILSQATARSLVVVDEIGRGTAAVDGQSIAQAVLEELVQLECRTLFATHFPELAAVPGIALRTLEVEVNSNSTDATKMIEDDSSPIFTHRVVPGVASSSYGVHVARLAGVPEHVVRRATRLMKQSPSL
eukprot:g3672.t1